MKRLLPLLALLGLAGCLAPDQPELTREIPWALVATPLVMDSHSHTRFSDGNLSVAELVRKAVENGCDALAITDHSDLSVRAATPAYFEAIDQARRDHPEILLFAGLEWNVPPYGGREHMALLLAPDKERLLAQFRRRFEPEEADALAGLRWLAERAPSRRDGVAFYAHPSRKQTSRQAIREDFLRWHTASPLLAGFEGAPGHQKNRPIGSYRTHFRTLDRWDPVVAGIDDTWDNLLDQGYDVWGALTVSDYHNHHMDEPPCAFARLHVLAEDPSHGGVLAGLRAGSFWSDHGRLLDRLDFVLHTPGLPLPASPGEAVRLPPDHPVTLAVTLERGPGAAGSPLVLELIGNGLAGEPQLIAEKSLPAGATRAQWTFDELKPGADGRSAYFRLRVRKAMADGPDLLAHSNPIRLYLD